MPFQDLAPIQLPTHLAAAAVTHKTQIKIIFFLPLIALCFRIYLMSSICFLLGVKYPMQPVRVTCCNITSVCVHLLPHLCVARHFSECPPAGAVPRSISGLRNGGRQSLLGEPVPKILPVSPQISKFRAFLEPKF